MMITGGRQDRWALAVLAVAIGVELLAGGPAAWGGEAYRIGSLQPLTGAAAKFGELVKNGQDLAADQINRAGGIDGRKLEIVYEDSKASPKTGVEALNLLIDVHKTPAVVVQISGVVLASIPIANQKKTILFDVASLAPSIREGGPYIFSNLTKGDTEGRAQADLVTQQLKAKTVALMFANNEFGQSVSQVIRQRVEQNGAKVVAAEAHNLGSKEFKAQLTKIQAANPDVIILSSFDLEDALIIKQARELGMKVQFVGHSVMGTDRFLGTAGAAAEGAIFSSTGWDPTEPSPMVQDYIKAYKVKYKSDPELYGSTAYDATRILAQAIKDGGYTSDGVRRALLALKDFPGVTGPTTFDSHGMVDKPVRFHVIKDGKIAPYRR